MDFRQEMDRLRKSLEDEPIMNDERKVKLLLLIDIMEDVLLEEDCVRSFFKDIRGGEAT